MTSRTFVCILAFTLAMLATLSCGSGDSNGRISAEDAQRKSHEAIETAKDYLSEERRAFIENNEQRIAEIEEKAKAWSAKLDDLREDVRERGRDELAEIKAKAKQARRQLSELKQETDAASEDLKAGAEAAIDDLRKACDRAASRFQGNS